MHTDYVRLGKQLVARVESAGSIADSSTVPFNNTIDSLPSGGLTGRNFNLPFGKSIGSANNSDSAIGFTGHVKDLTGLTYMQARYYDPVIGRFYSNDPLPFRDIYSFNRYAYVNNNPFRYTDPDGRKAVGRSLGTIIGSWLHGENLEESTKSAAKTSISMGEGVKEAVSFTSAGIVLESVEITLKVINRENIADNIAGWITGKLTGGLTEKLVKNKDVAEVMSALVAKFSGDAAKSWTAGQINKQGTSKNSSVLFSDEAFYKWVRDANKNNTEDDTEDDTDL